MTASPSRDVQNVLSRAHEVRIKLQSERVIFATVASVAHDELEVVVRPWGRKGLLRLALRDVRTAKPVCGMLWRTQQNISDAQARERD